MNDEKKIEEVKITEMSITYNNITGAITVNGPLENKIFCIGLLETAKEAVKDFKLAPMDA